jgi:hypothetical protein
MTFADIQENRESVLGFIGQLARESSERPKRAPRKRRRVHVQEDLGFLVPSTGVHMRYAIDVGDGTVDFDGVR